MKTFLVVLALFSFQSFGQTGLYGKRSIIEIQGIGSTPLFYNWFNGSRPVYKSQGTNLVDSPNLFDFGFRANVMRAFSNQVGLGFEFGFERQIFGAPTSVLLNAENGFFTGAESFDIRHEKIRLNTITLMPKLEFSTRSNLLPIGLSHQIGVGFTRIKVDERDYAFDISNPNNDSIITPIENGFIDYDKSYTGFTVMYQINMRTPITDQIVITYGIRYNANFVRKSRPVDSPPSLGEFDLINEARNRRNPSFIQLNFGVGFAF